MTHDPAVIVGAGLAGLIAAYAWPRAQIHERAAQPTEAHRALLRFRSDAVARLTGVEFRRVLVRKGIWHDGAFRPPDIRYANWYAAKCTGGLAAERSIWDTAPAERYVAPDNLYTQLLDGVRARVRWGAAFNFKDEAYPRPVISTAPLMLALPALSDAPAFNFQRAAITVQRYTLPPAVDLHQTVYFPNPALLLYRASITGHTLILEYAGADAHRTDLDAGLVQALQAFGLSGWGGAIKAEGERTSQRFGKITPLPDDAARKAALFRLTHERGVYSLGRFATWRNILLDDVVNDIAVIKRMLRGNAGAYDLRAAGAAK